MKKTAEEIVKLIVNEAKYSEVDETYILDESQVEFLAEIIASQSLPPVSEEEIKTKPFIHQLPSTVVGTFINYDGTIKWKEYAEALDMWILSRLPQREVGQPEGKKEEERCPFQATKRCLYACGTDECRYHPNNI